MSRLLPVPVFVLSSCDLTMTLDPVVYEDLDQQQRSAADRIFARLQAYDARLRAVSAGSYGLGPIAEDRDRIDVAIEGKWILLNLGDDRIHITTWEGLTAVQRERWARHYDKILRGSRARTTDPDDPAGHIWFRACTWRRLRRVGSSSPRPSPPNSTSSSASGPERNEAGVAGRRGVHRPVGLATARRGSAGTPSRRARCSREPCRRRLPRRPVPAIMWCTT